MKFKENINETQVIVYDRYRFAIPIKGVIIESIAITLSFKVKLLTTNNPLLPVGSDIYVFPEQCRKFKSK